MEVNEILRNRRSIRKYTGERLSDGQINEILGAGLLGPSSMNKRPIEYIVVSDEKMLKTLSESKAHGSAMLEGASHAVVVIGDASKADAWIEDASIAMAYMMLKAEEMGIASCWVQIRLRKTAEEGPSGDYVKEALGIPEKFEVEAILSLGIPAEKEEPRDWNETEMYKVHMEKY